MCCFPSITGLSADGERTNRGDCLPKYKGKRISIHGLGKWYAKFMTGKYRPLISFTICTNQIHFPKKQLRKPETGIKGDFDENGTRISAWNIWNTKTLPFLFRNSVAHRSFFNWNDLKSHVPLACQLDFLETFCIW